MLRIFIISILYIYIKNYANVCYGCMPLLLNYEYNVFLRKLIYFSIHKIFTNVSEKPLILVTNDDGITAPGIRALIEVMKQLGEVIVVAPDSPQSGMGHAITISDTLFCDQVTVKETYKHKEYSCSGTPADCVKIATQEILHRKPDLCVSGINHGSNSSINVIYSGTMSAAVEAGIEGIPAIGFSLLDYSLNADFEPSKKFVKTITTAGAKTRSTKRCGPKCKPSEVT